MGRAKIPPGTGSFEQTKDGWPANPDRDRLAITQQDFSNTFTDIF